MPISFERGIVLLFALCIVASLPLYPALEGHFQGSRAWRVVRTLFLAAVFFLSVGCVIGGAYSPFIYFNF